MKKWPQKQQMKEKDTSYHGLEHDQEKTEL